jgi:D-alanyl-D-alanine carboxypeptidase/D-alanyl-D-alanine-endopeptidase (penicillin-binding protein 4)
VRRAPTFIIAAILVASVVGPALPAAARPRWKQRIDKAIGNREVGVAVRDAGTDLYKHAARTKRAPASNQKLLMAAALIDKLGLHARIKTTIAAPPVQAGVVAGNVWMLGRGDPTIGPMSYTDDFSFGGTRISKIARAIDNAGVVRIEGRVKGATGYFSHDWFAPGWKSDFAAEEVPLPSALTYKGNIASGRHISDPEVRAARALTTKLEARGIVVTGKPGAGTAPGGLSTLAKVRSEPLEDLLRYTERQSSNFFAEVLGKRLGVAYYGRPGTIAKGAEAAVKWADDLRENIVARDSSGLSYENRVSPRSLADLLGYVETRSWGPAFRKLLPKPGQGTLEDRLHGIDVRAKTGTLDGISALSGYVLLDKTGKWAEFSILSGGIPKYEASALEDKIVKILSTSAR